MDRTPICITDSSSHFPSNRSCEHAETDLRHQPHIEITAKKVESNNNNNNNNNHPRNQHQELKAASSEEPNSHELGAIR